MRKRSVVAVRLASLCCAVAWPAIARAQEWRLVPGSAKQGAAAMCWDGARQRAVLFGGEVGSTLISNAMQSLDATHRFDPRGSNPGPTPPARWRHAMAYDSARDRVVLFGGDGSADPQVYGPLSDTWEFDGSTWTERLGVGSPGPRFDTALSYDTARGTMVLFGGTNNATVGAWDTWTYDGMSWRLVPLSLSASAIPRFGHTQCYDSTQRVTVIYGGQTLFGLSTDAWTFDGTRWQLLVNQAMPNSVNNLLGYDPSRQQLVLLTNLSSVFAQPAAFELQNGSWTSITPPPMPTGHAATAMVFDPVAGRLLASDGTVFWSFDGTTWAPRGAVPTPSTRSGAAQAWDQTSQRTMLFGGAESGTNRPLADTWVNAAGNWLELHPPHAPSAREQHAMAQDLERGRTVLFGGIDAALTVRADTWEFDGLDWTARATTHVPPPRHEAAMVYDSARHRAVLFGGHNRNGYLVDTWEYDGSDWRERTNSANLPGSPRWGHAMAYDIGRGCTVLHGGTAGTTAFQDTWEYRDGVWSQVFTAAQPPARSGASLAYDSWRGVCVLAGGGSDCWVFDGNTWRATAASPYPVTDASMVHDQARDRMLRVGGISGSARFPITLAGTWELLPATGAQWARYGSGCTFGGATPSLDAAPGRVPALGSRFALQVGNLPQQPGTVVVLYGFDLATWAGFPLPRSLFRIGLPDCSMWLAPLPGIAQLVPHHGAPVGTFLDIPAVPALAGTRLAAQAMLIDATRRTASPRCPMRA